MIGRFRPDKNSCSNPGLREDPFATAALEGVHGVLVMPVRGGRSLGNRTYFPRTRSGTESDEVLQAFLKQYYLSRAFRTYRNSVSRALSKSMTPRQQRFVNEYLIDTNATQAAARAGYKWPDKVGSQLLGKTRIREAIAERQVEHRALMGWVARVMAGQVPDLGHDLGSAARVAACALHPVRIAGHLLPFDL